MPWDESQLTLRENMREPNYNRDLKLRAARTILSVQSINISVVTGFETLWFSLMVLQRNQTSNY